MFKYFLLLIALIFIMACGGSGADDPAVITDTDDHDSGQALPENDSATTSPQWDSDDFEYVYEVGPGQVYENPAEISWADLLPGTMVRIHWRAEPYRAKWVVTTTATETHPLVITGVPDDNGNLPVITGEDAVTPYNLYYLNEARSVVKIGNYTGSEDDSRPAHIFLENLNIKSARPVYNFVNRYGQNESYTNNAAAVHIEEGDYITIQGCDLHDSGNGLFSSHLTSAITISGNHIYDNGIEGRYYEHNTYTESLGIVYQYNFFGPLRPGCDGNNLKDRSSGTIVRYNWIEGGNRQLDLVETDYESFFQDSHYQQTFVYGNILIEPDGAGNSQIIHYGGDGDDETYYRKGTIYLYHNTIISKRAGNTTLIRLSTNDATADIRNNIIYTTASPGHLALTNGQGIVNLYTNWLPENYRFTFESTNNDINDASGNLTGLQPGFADFGSDDFRLISTAEGAGAAGDNAVETDAYPVDRQYRQHQTIEERTLSGFGSDLGAYQSN